MDDERDLFEDETGADHHEDMWDSVEVDSEFEGLSDEDIYADMDVDLETVDDEKMESEETDRNHSRAHHHHHQVGHIHHHGVGQGGDEANQAMIDAVTPFVAPQQQEVGERGQEEEEDDDEEEANYATQVERYNRYHQSQAHEDMAMDVDSDETEDEEDEATLTRLARTRRPAKRSSATPHAASQASHSQSSRQARHSSSHTSRAKSSSRRENRDFYDDSDAQDSDADSDYRGHHLSDSRERSASRAKRRTRSTTSSSNAAGTSQDLEKLRIAVTKEFQTAIDAKRKEMQEIERRIEQTRLLWERLQNIWVNKEWNENLLSQRVQAAEEYRNAKRSGRPLKHERLSTNRQMKEHNDEMETIMKKLDASSASSAAASSALLSSVDPSNGTSGGPPPRKKKKVETVARPLFCLTPAKGFVQVVCPDCKRTMFGNHLGFLNHCRMVHSIKFTSWDDAVELCGHPVDESEVPADDPARTESMAASSLGFSISLQKSEAAKSYQLQRSGIPNSSRLAPQPLQTFHGGITIDHSKPKDSPDAVKIATPHLHASQTATENSSSASDPHRARNAASHIPSGSSLQVSRFYIKKQVIIGNTYKKLTKNDLTNETEEMKLLLRPSAMVASTSHSTPNNILNGANTLNSPLQPTHRWMIYVRPIGDESLSNYIAKVRFYLHPAFKPRHVVEVAKPPFQLIRETNQEWPVRLQIFFNDARNKPMSFVHYVVFHQGTLEAVGEEYYADIEIDREFTENMVLDENVSLVALPSSNISPSSHDINSHSRQFSTREEQAAKFKSFLDSNPMPQIKSQTLMNFNPSDGASFIHTSGLENNLSAQGETTSSRSSRYGRSAQQNQPNELIPMSSSNLQSNASSSSHHMHSIDGLHGQQIPISNFSDFVRQVATTMCPLISSESIPSLPYSVAKSQAEWSSWSHGKRKSSEWQRALRISRLLTERLHVRYRTREVLDLCHHLNLTPIADDAVVVLNSEGNELLNPSPFSGPDANIADYTPVYVPPISLYNRLYALPMLRERCERLEMADISQLSNFVRFCRFCGSLHTPIDRIEELEIACGEKKLLVLQETHSTFRELLERSIKQVKQINADRLRTHPSSSTSSSSTNNATDVGTSTMSVDSKANENSKPSAKRSAPKQRASSENKNNAQQSKSQASTILSTSSSSSKALGEAQIKEQEKSSSAANASSSVGDTPAKPPRRGRPAKLSKLATLLTSPAAATTLVTTTPGTLEAPSSATVVLLDTSTAANELLAQHGIEGTGSSATAGVSGGVIENSSSSSAPTEPSAPTSSNIASTETVETKPNWDIDRINAMPPMAFIDFLKHLSPEQITNLPPLSSDRLALLAEYLSNPTGDSSSEIQDLENEHSELPSATASKSTDKDSRTNLHAEDSKQSSSSSKMAVDDEKENQKRKSSSAKSRANAKSSEEYSAMDVVENHKDPNSASSDAEETEEAQSKKNSKNGNSAETLGGAEPKAKNSTSATQQPSSSLGDEWTAAQEAVLLGYYMTHPDALANKDPLPPDVLEALYLAGLPPSEGEASTTNAANLNSSNSNSSVPASASAPIATPSKQSKSKRSKSIAATLQITVEGGNTQNFESSISSAPPSKPANVKPHVGGAGTSAHHNVLSAPHEHALGADGSALWHPTFDTLDFRRCERPSVSELPALHEELDSLRLDYDTTNHAEMLLLKLISSFARRLLFASAVAHATEKATEPAHESKYKVVVPLHMASAVVKNPINFDFLTSEGLARYNSLQMIDAQALNTDLSANEIMTILEPRLELHRQMAAADERLAAQQGQLQTQQNAQDIDATSSNHDDEKAKESEEATTDKKSGEKDSQMEIVDIEASDEKNSPKLEENGGSNKMNVEKEKI